MKQLILVLLLCIACTEEDTGPDCNVLRSTESTAKAAWQFAVRERPTIDPALAQWIAAGKDPEWVKNCNTLQSEYIKASIEYNKHCK